MLKMIIVDDESGVLQLIKSLVLWDELGIQNIGEADNGIAAFEMIVSKKPDIVITDIRMPGMDGLELVRKTRELGLKTNFILVSGHKQFEYAQNALRYGVVEYLVKPIEEDELNNILRKLRERFLEENGRIENDRLIKNQLQSNREMLHRQFMQQLIHEPEHLNLKNIQEINAKYQLNFTEGVFQAFTFKVDRKIRSIEDCHLDHAAEQIPQIFKNNFENKCFEIVPFINRSKIIILTNFKNQDALSSTLRSTFNEVQQQIGKHKNLVLTIGIGSIETKPEAMVNSVCLAIDAEIARLKLGNEKIIDGSTLKFKKIAFPEILPSVRESQFVHLVEALDRAAILKWIKNLFLDIDARAELHPKIYIDVALYVYNLFLQLENKLGLESKINVNLKFSDQLPNAITVYEIQDLLTNFINDKLEYYLQTKRAQDAKPIRIAKQYINDHYFEPITLEQVANEIHLNPVYFSIVFKKEVGINFSDYLISCRMEIAKDLLKNTFLTNIEIAEKVGYKDSRYFSKLFSKIVGVTPGEYRKLYA